jgi:L-ornithine N5-monooxygenase
MDHPPSGPKTYDVIGVGFGPSNLSLAVCLDELSDEHGRKLEALFIEKQPKYAWHGETLVGNSTLQISFLKDLVSLRNPTSAYSFVNYLHQHGRLVDFINMGTFYPSRLEFDDYLRWVAGHFAKQAMYGEQVLRVEPVRIGRQIDRLKVVSRSVSSGEERQRMTRSLVIASGGAPKIPGVFQACQDDPRVFHHARYLSSVKRLPCAENKPMRIAVVGGGQSAVEAFVDLHDSFPSVKVDLIIRASALKPADSSPFVNEVFAPAYIDQIFRATAEQQQKLVEEFQNTNYAVADLDMIERIYNILYHQKVTGEERHQLLARTQIEQASAAAHGVTLRLRDQGSSYERLYDAVVLATGYDRRAHHELLDPLKGLLGDIKTNRNYRVEADASLTAPIYLQGFSEATHGLSETLLSVLPIRSEKIVSALYAALSNGGRHLHAYRDSAVHPAAAAGSLANSK